MGPSVELIRGGDSRHSVSSGVLRATSPSKLGLIFGVTIKARNYHLGGLYYRNRRLTVEISSRVGDYYDLIFYIGSD